MHCAACVGRVEQAIKRVPGVQDATVNLLAERGVVTFDATQATPQAMIAAVETAGFDAALARMDHFAPAAEDAPKLPTDRRTEAQELTHRFLVSLALTVPVLMMGMGPHLGLISMRWTMLPWWNRAQLLLTTPVLLWAGNGFFRGAWAALRQRASDMNTLIVVGTSAAYAYSLAVTVAPGFFAARGLNAMTGGVYYETAAVIVTLILMGRLLEARAKRGVGTAIAALIGLQPKTARVLRDEKEVDVPLGEVQVGDRLLVAPARSACGRRRRIGAVVGGESMLTGESLPVEKKEGANVTGATLNQRGAFTMEAGAWAAIPRSPRSCALWSRRRAAARPSSGWPM